MTLNQIFFLIKKHNSESMTDIIREYDQLGRSFNRDLGVVMSICQNLIPFGTLFHNDQEVHERIMSISSRYTVVGGGPAVFKIIDTDLPEFRRGGRRGDENYVYIACTS